MADVTSKTTGIPTEPPMPVKSGSQPDNSSLIDSLINQTPQPIKAQNVTADSIPIKDEITPKKHSSFGVMLAGVIILMITLPIAIYFISQQNTRVTEQRSCAAGDEDCIGDPGVYAHVLAPPGICNSRNCCHAYLDKTCSWRGGDDGYCLCTGSTDTCSNWGQWGECHKDLCNCVQTRYCGTVSGQSTTYQIRGCSDASCVPCEETPQPPPDGSITATPTPLPGQCTRIRVYKNDISVDPNVLSVGDVVQIAVAGSSAEKGRIRVNGGGWGETSVLNAQNEYYISYTIPSGITSFTIEAEIFTNNEWK